MYFVTLVNKDLLAQQYKQVEGTLNIHDQDTKLPPRAPSLNAPFPR